MTLVIRTDPEVIERFKVLFAAVPELDYMEIAGSLNHQFRLALTKSAIAGMARRAGLSRRAAYTGGRKPRKAKQVKRLERKLDAIKAAKAVEMATRSERDKAAAERLAAMDPDNVFDGTGIKGLVRLVKLNDKTCRWPFEMKGSTLYCGNVVTFKPYCTIHHKLALPHGSSGEPKPHRNSRGSIQFGGAR